MNQQIYSLGRYRNAGMDLQSVCLNAGELVALFCRPPIELKVYLALRAHALDGEVCAQLHTLPRRLMGWLQYERDAGTQIHRFNIMGERDSSRYAEDNELKVIRQAMKRLANDGLIMLADRERADGRIENVCTFPEVNEATKGGGKLNDSVHPE